MRKKKLFFSFYSGTQYVNYKEIIQAHISFIIRQNQSQASIQFGMI